MKTLLLKIDDAIHLQVCDFLKLLPKKQCHIIETQQSLETHHKMD